MSSWRRERSWGWGALRLRVTIVIHPVKKVVEESDLNLSLRRLRKVKPQIQALEFKVGGKVRRDRWVE